PANQRSRPLLLPRPTVLVVGVAPAGIAVRLVWPAGVALRITRVVVQRPERREQLSTHDRRAFVELVQRGAAHVPHRHPAGQRTGPDAAIGGDREHAVSAMPAKLTDAWLLVAHAAADLAQPVDGDASDAERCQLGSGLLYVLVLLDFHDTHPDRDGTAQGLDDVLAGPPVAPGSAPGDRLMRLGVGGVVARGQADA